MENRPIDVLREVQERFDGVDNGYCQLCRTPRACDTVNGRALPCSNDDCLSTRLWRAIGYVPEGCKLTAHDTGDGWALDVQDSDGEHVGILDWPKAWPDSMWLCLITP